MTLKDIVEMRKIDAERRALYFDEEEMFKDACIERGRAIAFGEVLHQMDEDWWKD